MTKHPMDQDFSEPLPGARITNEMLGERLEGLRGMMETANADRILHVAEDRLAHAEFRLAIEGLRTQAAVSRSEFKWVQVLVYSMVGSILLGVLGAGMALVLRGHAPLP